MPEAKFFAKLGIYVDEHFLDSVTCQQISREMLAVNCYPAKVLGEDEDVYDASARQTLVSAVSEITTKTIYQKIKALRPALENHFKGRKLGKIEKLKFLRYCPGDFFAAHHDGQMGRSLNITIYLNKQTDDPKDDEYAGGELHLYGLIDKPGWQDKSFALNTTAGLICAYPSELWHEVDAVKFGERQAIVTHIRKQE